MTGGEARERGMLMAIGGAEDKAHDRLILRRFVALAGGAAARIAIVPPASSIDVAGIDFLTPDIARSVKGVGGAICEVNAGPGFRMHTRPTEGIPRDVARPVIALLYPRDAPSRVPIAAITGTNGKTTTSRMIAPILKMAGRKVGLTTTDGIYIDGTQIAAGNMSGPGSARMVLQNPTIDTAVLETARGGIVRPDLGHDRADVAADHLGLGGIHTLEELARVKGTVAASTHRRGTTVLNADDPRCIAMAERTRAKICYVSMQPDAEPARGVLERHLKGRGTATIVRATPRGEAICCVARRRRVCCSSTRSPPPSTGRARADERRQRPRRDHCLPGVGDRHRRDPAGVTHLHHLLLLPDPRTPQHDRSSGRAGCWSTTATIRRGWSRWPTSSAARSRSARWR